MLTLSLVRRFLLAKLQLGSIMHNAVCAKDLFDSLEKLPSGVDAMYRLTLQRVAAQPPKVVSVAHRVFVWLLYSAATLSTKDMQQALAVDTNSYTFERDAVVDVELVLSACQGLVTTTESSDDGEIFRFVRKSCRPEWCETASLNAPPHT